MVENKNIFKLTTEDVVQVRKPVRYIAWVIFFLCAPLVLLLSVALFIDFNINEIYGLSSALFLAYLSYPVAKTGYPPRYFLWLSSPREEETDSKTTI